LEYVILPITTDARQVFTLDMKGEKIMINWKVRIRNKQFWMSLIPAMALVVQAVAAVFGWELDFSSLTGKILTVVDAVFAVLVILGIVVDPTTAGVGDSERAMGYEEPWSPYGTQ